MNRVPLAERMRPQKLADVLGQEEIVGEGKILTELVKKGEKDYGLYNSKKAKEFSFAKVNDKMFGLYNFV